VTATPGLAAMCAPLTTLLVLTAFFVVPAPSCVMVPAAFASGTGPSLLLAYWHAALQRGVPENLRDTVLPSSSSEAASFSRLAWR
jgi:hypothetical protein